MEKPQRKAAEKSSRGYSVLWKVKKRNVDMLCRKLSLKYHLLLHLRGAQDEKSRELKSVFSDLQLQRLTHVRQAKAC